LFFKPFFLALQFAVAHVAFGKQQSTVGSPVAGAAANQTKASLVEDL